jgi:uncharacterized delta-60 repeat protein
LFHGHGLFALFICIAAAGSILNGTLLAFFRPQASRPLRGPTAPSGAVQEAWVARYNGPGNSYDEAHAIAVDSAANVYVTGSSVGLEPDPDYATIKYDTSGQEQWAVRYRGPGNSGNVANAIAVDGSGNVYVTGRSSTSGTDYDYATIKYNSAGQEQWAARYNGPANGVDDAVAIAVDGLGNVYVTGNSVGLGTNFDYATIKYNSAGQQQWVARYNGRANGDDYAAAIVLDASGNVYVTGGSAGSGTGDDYATIKYNSVGQQQWVARYNGPGNGGDHANAIAIDGSANIYVTGFSSNSENEVDCATIKYDSAGGKEQWVARYSAPVHILDYGDAIAVDSSGNVSVAGTSFASVNNGDYVTIKYNSTGQEHWVARYDGGIANGADYSTAIGLDTSGNVYVTGGSDGSGLGYEDYATIKYNSAGQQQWVARYDGPGNEVDRANAIAIDGSGNVYVTGRSYGSGTGLSDYATIKYVQGATPTPTPCTGRCTPTPFPRPTPAPRP